MTMRERAHERALLARFRQVLHALLAAIVEGGIGDVGPCRDRAFHHVEGRLELRILDCRSHLELRLLTVGTHFEHHELVGVEGHNTLRAWEANAHEIRARLLAGLDELALRPIAHDLHAGLAFDDHRRGQIPVTTGEVVVDIGSQLRHAIEHLLHGVGAERFGIKIDHRLLVEIGPAGRQQHAVEDGRILPRNATMRQGNDAIRLHLVEKGDEFVPVLGSLSAGRVESRLVDPYPVGRMDVDRCGDPLAVILGEFLKSRRNHLVPAFLRSDLVQIAEHALLGPVGDVKAEHLDCGRRIACRDAGAQGRHRLLATAAGDRHIGPGDALRFKVLLEHIERRSLAARGPPMEDFDLIGMGDQRKTGCKNSRQQQFAQHSFPPLGCDRTEWLLTTPLTSRLVKSDPRHK